VYSYYWTSKTKVSGKLNRIFRAGDDIEVRIVEALKSIGIETRDSQTTITDDTGHAGGSIDGIVSGVPDFGDMLFEGKSMNHNNFLEMSRKHVQASKPTHYVQMQMYMGRLNLPFALYVAMNKNTSDLYIEVVPFDEACFNNHVDLETHILECNHIEEFPMISSNPSWFTCKFCDFSHICHQGESVARNCRTCNSSYMEPGGLWICQESNVILSVKGQEEVCGAYELSEMWK
jgi:hypothetical protein